MAKGLKMSKKRKIADDDEETAAPTQLVVSQNSTTLTGQAVGKAHRMPFINNNIHCSL